MRQGIAVPCQHCTLHTYQCMVGCLLYRPSREAPGGKINSIVMCRAGQEAWDMALHSVTDCRQDSQQGWSDHAHANIISTI